MKADLNLAEAGADELPAPRGAMARLKAFGRALAQWMSSSLTRRIVVLNLAGLVALLVGFLYLNQFRQGLIEARVLSLVTQGDIIAGAIASSATVETDTITIDPDQLLQMQAGDTARFNDDAPSALEFSINPERVAPLLRRLVTPTQTRARIFDREGSLLLDSRTFYSRGDIMRMDLPPVTDDDLSFIERTWHNLRTLFRTKKRLILEDVGPSNGKTLPEVQRAFSGERSSEVRTNARGETIVSVAVPIQRLRTVQGVLLLSTQGGDIDTIIASERFALLQVFLVAAVVMIVLSLFLAGAIVGPVRRLAEAAERVRRGTRSRQEIPDFTGRSDEIGHLSGALRDMTGALYNRIDAIESFAADVAHELKNPLTSLRSAVETLPLARNDESRGRLMSIIQHDVRRLDRLISDISDASRLDAELARADAEPVDMQRLLVAVVSVANERRHAGDPAITLMVDPAPRDAYLVVGHDSRLGQVFNNLIDNARSFSPPDKLVKIHMRRRRSEIEILVDDCGPGIEPDALDRIFERFYTDRPEQGFGQNSGLGLSISRQIIEAHRGTIRAENRPGPAGEEPLSMGARFIIRLPAVGKKG
ncbi:sensor histidine kinase [Microvirga antarctica]|uniref:sensor histidine kinase n=1 Tax=Microvirga antarctica TaxID=2819233 RepID=UPI001B30258F|nr:sensor histidine kinase [Microvirga antarctica]